MRLDLWADIACPWCFIGERRLQRAMAELPAGAVAVHLRAFELQPDLPPEGADARVFYGRKFGGEERMRMMFERVAGVARADGIAMDFDKMRRAPNTRLAHRIIALAGDAALAAADALYRGHFEEGANVSDVDEALAALARHGVAVDVEDLRARLARGEGEDQVRDDESLAARLGIGGVPFFLAEGRLAMSGAQPVADMVSFLRSALDGDDADQEGRP